MNQQQSGGNAPRYTLSQEEAERQAEQRRLGAERLRQQKEAQADAARKTVQEVVCTVLGAVLALPTILFTLGVLAFLLLPPIDLGMCLFSAALAAGFGFGSFKFFRRVKRLRRAARYKSFLEGWAGCTLKEMSGPMNTSVKDLKKDLEILISKGYLEGAWLDKQDGVLFADHASYNDYVAERRARRKKAEQEKREKQQPVEPGFAGQANSFLRQVEEIKPEVDAPAAREQVEKMEHVVREIRDWITEHPDSEDKVRRLSSYYLPTTLKLLRTYIAVDDNPGPTAQNICRNITGNLETFNAALLNMQDSLLDDTALDVSAEISVLESMLQQEGLTGEQDFPLVAIRGEEDEEEPLHF